MSRTAFVFILSLITTPLLAQIDSSSNDSSQQPKVGSNPELEYSGTEYIIGKDTSINDAVLSDSLSLPSETAPIAQKPKENKSDIETTINYNARDSMNFDIANRKLFLYGDTHIDYDKISLDGDATSINWSDRTLSSKFTLDTLGRKRGKPVFAQGNDVYETDDILYNFKTGRAIIKGVVTEQNGAFMHGEDVKKNEDDELFIKGAKYTTCNLSDPHFFIESNKLKVIPGNKVVSGPFNLKFREIPTPLWLPFGMFPQPRKQASGIVFPSYGEETNRGFFIRNGGYYFGFSEYIDLTLLGSVYSKGSYSLEANSNYKVRYKVTGSINLSYTKNVSRGAEFDSETNSFWVRWSHKPETRGNSSFSASVSAGSTNYNDQNNLAISNNLQRSITSEFTSSVSYTQKFNRLPINMSTNFRQSQNVQTGIYSWTLPDFALNVNRIYPFKGLVKSSKSPIAKLSFSHNFVAKNVITNSPLSTNAFNFNVVNESTANTDTLKFTIENLSRLYDRAKIGGRHSIPISTSFSLLKHFTVSPSFNYQELWYTRELDYTYIDGENGVRVDTVEGFSRAGSWTSGASVNTRIYGMYYMRGIAGIEAIRHVMTPSISFTYNPDFGSEKYGVYQTIQVDTTGATQRVSKYQGFAYGSPTGNKSQTVSFSLTNNIEMKVRTRKDTANEFKKVKVFDNLSMSSGYNFASDSFRLSNISWNARTSLFNSKVSLTLSGAYDPYIYQENGTETGRRVDKYAWNNGEGLGNLSTLNTAISFSLKPKNSKKGNQQNNTNTNSAFDDNGSRIDDSEYGTPEEKEYVKQNPNEYVDFNLPWSLRVSYNINRRKTGLADAEISSHGMQFSGTLGLTDNTQITFSSGYDIKNQDFTQTRLGVVRDLHCWTMNFSWVPFGRYQSFSLILQPKSSLLQDLKLQKRRSFQDFFSN